MNAEQHFAHAQAQTVEIKRLERKIETAKRRRRRAWLLANRAGLTYDKIVALSGFSDGYVCREFRLARAEGPEALRDRPTRTPAHPVNGRTVPAS